MDHLWETCAVMGGGWFWRGGKDIKSLNTCLRLLTDCAGGDGNLLLDFGPRPDGKIHPPFKENYLGMGRWLKKYGESIRKTRGGPYKPGLWGVSTRRGKTVYLHVTQKWPGGLLILPALSARVVSCRALTGGKPEFKQTADSLVITLKPMWHAYPDTIIALTLDSSAMGIEPIDMPDRYSLTVDAKVTASSSANPKAGRGAPETVVQYRWEEGVISRYFGEDDVEQKTTTPTKQTHEALTEQEKRIKKPSARRIVVMYGAIGGQQQMIHNRGSKWI